jgi:inhibitor of cysteine peptidase
MPIKKLLYLAVCSIILISVSFAQSKNKDANIYSEDKQSIFVTRDQPDFKIKLKSNPTTGFSWFLREYDPSLITAVKHEFQAAEGKVKMIGAPGFEIWSFHMKPAAFTVPQQTTIRMVYTRPWDGSEGSSQLVFRIVTGDKVKNP